MTGRTFHVQKNQFCNASMLASAYVFKPSTIVSFHWVESIQKLQSPP